MAKLEILTGQYTEFQFQIDGDIVWIGSGEQCNIRLQEPGISKHHAQIFCEDGERFWVEDAGGSFGTLLNGQHVERAALSGGDELTLGRVKMRFVVEQTDSSLSLPSVVLEDDEPVVNTQETVIAPLSSVLELAKLSGDIDGAARLEELDTKEPIDGMSAEGIQLDSPSVDGMTAEVDASMIEEAELLEEEVWDEKTPLGSEGPKGPQHTGEFEMLGADDLLLEEVDGLEVLDDDDLHDEVIELDEDSLIPQETPLDDDMLAEEGVLTEGTVLQAMPLPPEDVAGADVRESTDPGGAMETLGSEEDLHTDEPTHFGPDPRLGLLTGPFATAPPPPPSIGGVPTAPTELPPAPATPPAPIVPPAAPAPSVPQAPGSSPSLVPPPPKAPSPAPPPITPTPTSLTAASSPLSPMPPEAIAASPPQAPAPTRPPVRPPLPAALSSHTLTGIRRDEVKSAADKKMAEKSAMREDVKEVTSATRSRTSALYSEMLELQEHLTAREEQIVALQEQLIAQQSERQHTSLISSTLAIYKEDNKRLQHQLSTYEKAAEENEALLRKMEQLSREVDDLSGENRALRARVLQYRKLLIQHGLLRKGSAKAPK